LKKKISGYIEGGKQDKKTTQNVKPNVEFKNKSKIAYEAAQVLCYS